MTLITIEEALLSNSKYYFTGKPCANGHVDKRYTNTKICYECKRLQAKRDYIFHKDRIFITNKRSYKKHLDKRIIRRHQWTNNNRKKSNSIKKAWKLRNRDVYLLKCREYVKLKRQDPIWRLNANVSLGIWKSLKTQKAGNKWRSFVSYSLEELKKHLESKFGIGMTWGNYGSYWEIDHIKPKSLCSSFNETWALTNLQPLECSKNRSKCNRFIG